MLSSTVGTWSTHDSKTSWQRCRSNGNQVTATGHCVTDISNRGCHLQWPSGLTRT